MIDFVVSFSDHENFLQCHGILGEDFQVKDYNLERLNFLTLSRARVWKRITKTLKGIIAQLVHQIPNHEG